MSNRLEQNRLWDAVETIHHYYEDLFRPVAASFALTVGQLRVLHLLHRFGPLSVGELALAAGMARTNMSSLCKKLSKDGFLIRHRGSSGDDRQVVLELTPEGESAARQAESRLDGAEASLKEESVAALANELSTLAHSLSPQGEQIGRLNKKKKTHFAAARNLARALLRETAKKELQHETD